MASIIACISEKASLYYVRGLTYRKLKRLRIMKNTERKNLIFGFLSKAGLKRMTAILYCIVPLLIFAVGFSAWTIIGHDVKSGGGSFVADGIINSYDYITVDTTDFGDINLYPTGIYDSEGKIADQATIEAKYTLQIGKCYADLLKTATDKKLYADFTLNFVDGKGYSAFYNNLSYEVTVEGAANTIKENTGLTHNGVTFTGAQKATDSSYTVSLTMDLTNFSLGENNEHLNDTFTLSFKYTLAPKAADYQTVYNKLVSEDLKLMVDVRITDVAPVSA